MGTTVKISTKDVSDLTQTQELLRLALSCGKGGVSGVFNVAMVLSDALFDNQTAEQFRKVLAPKAQATRNLDVVCRELCPQMDYFVCFSSISCGRGNSGQSNYGFANSVMERVCERRRAQGLHGLAIQWGAIGDVGVVAETMGGNETVIGGTLPQRMNSCLATLDHCLQEHHSVMSSVVRADHKIDATNKKGNLMKTIAHILGLKDHTSLDRNTTLGELGMDSLMSVEVKQTLERDYDCILNMEDIRRLTHIWQ
ncbi:unnamed protein product [Oppiella nova]|uniref:Carrier domain-containing protein n=1 Tax=Oppiella nova TaxID=334625 RepID=A0A7R9MRB8_9ACAR|nr:unnamed protein product [Oppiella nova]CAG2180964.1 unnamed protein product [Oppiella nova]